MDHIATFQPSEREALRALFADNKRDRVMIECVLEDRLGQAAADSPEAPSVARLDHGVFTILGGDPHHPMAVDLLRCKPILFVSPESEEWGRLLESEYGEKAIPLSFTAFDSRSLDANHLEALSGVPPSGYEVRKMDLPLAAQLLEDFDTDEFIDSFESVEDFATRGVGYLALHQGVIVSAATSFAASSKGIDIDIQTQPEHRRKGLATQVGARLLLDCLERQVEPHWLAANRASEGLALKLGYTKRDSYLTFMMAGE
jgi:GNAT superfamily N-acetyltransferase